MPAKILGKKRIRREKQTSRDQILDKAALLIGKRGWEASTFAAIAKATKMSPANIAYHFESREVLLSELLGHMARINITMVEAALKPEFNAYQRILTHILMNLQYAKENPEGAMVLIHIYGSACHDPYFSERYAAMIERAEGRIKDHLLAGEREGLFRIGNRADFLARTIHDLIVGAFIKMTASRLKKTVTYDEAGWESILKPLLGMR